MSLADSVPGVSGGTVAFILGFYELFISSLDNLIRGNKQERIEALKFLVKFAVGWVVGFGLSAFILTSIFNDHIYAVVSLFLGFIIFAIPLVVLEEKEAVLGRYRNIIFTVLGCALVVLISVASPATSGGVDVAWQGLTLGTAAFIFFSAMIAITAMILPGISGSTLMLIFGLYIPMMTAVRGVIGMDMAYLPAFLIFIVGAALGVVVFVRLIRYCLEHFRSQSIYFIIGMMIGSLYSITQGPLTLEVPKEALSIDTFSIVFFIIGGVVVLGLQFLKRFMEEPAKDKNQKGAS